MKTNIILCGLWFSREKPAMHTFFTPILDMINTLYRRGMDYKTYCAVLGCHVLHNHIGVKVTTPDGDFTCKTMIALCTADLPAKASLCNMKAFNGEHACPTCDDPGDNTRGSSPLHRLWLFTANMQIRTSAEVKTAFTKATETGKAVNIALPSNNLSI